MPQDLERRQSVSSGPRTGRRLVWVLLSAVVLLGIGLVTLMLMTPNRPPGTAAAVSATFLGYTNNPVGTRVAIFSINNRSPLPVRREWYYEVQVLTDSTWVPQPKPRLPYARGPVIPPNQSEIWTIKAPAAEGKWRVWFPYVEHQSRFQDMKETIRRKLRGLGLPLKSAGVTYTGLTDEVEPTEAQPAEP